MKTPSQSPLFALDTDIKALYIHVPFCVRKCAYCAFESQACPQDSPAMDAFVNTMCTQIRSLAKAGLLSGVQTVYVGGGTPSHLGLGNLGLLLQVLGLSINLDACKEVTCEVNPESFSEAMAKDLRSLGVTRVSVGVQSLNDEILTFLGRSHSAAKAHQALEILQNLEMEYSADIICGIPGQTVAGLVQDIQEIVALGAHHISVYPLTYEEGTPLWQAAARGKIPKCDEDAQAEMLIAAHQILVQLGFNHYEIANYAKPGHEAIHNSSYWTGDSYLGLGSGAASFISPAWPGLSHPAGQALLPQNMQQIVAQLADPSRYGLRFVCGQEEGELLDEETLLREHLMLLMRLRSGISHDEAAAASSILPGLQNALQRCIADGLAEQDRYGTHLTLQGQLLGNQVFSRILFC